MQVVGCSTLYLIFLHGIKTKIFIISFLNVSHPSISTAAIITTDMLIHSGWLKLFSATELLILMHPVESGVMDGRPYGTPCGTPLTN